MKPRSVLTAERGGAGAAVCAARRQPLGTGARGRAKPIARMGPSPRPKEIYIAILAAAGIFFHLALRCVAGAPRNTAVAPLYVVLVLGGIPLLADLCRKLARKEFGSDLLAGMSILTSVLLGEYLVAVIVVLMLSGGTALEQFAVRRASSALEALAKRMPQRAHRKTGAALTDVLLAEIAVGDTLLVLPHETCPVDGTVIEGQGRMDESYLTGEPFEIGKARGSLVFSGAINGDTALTLRAEKLAVDSRYAKIMRVMEASEQNRPRLRRLGDRLGAWYTPLALAVATGAWLANGDAHRFLAVMVIATPCPLLIAIPVAVIGAVSVAARRGIVIKNPAVLEQIDTCRTLILDKTGTLTYGRPTLTEITVAPGFGRNEVLCMAARLEQYSKHPLAGAILRAARNAKLDLGPVTEISEKPGQGLRGIVAGRVVEITSRTRLGSLLRNLPPATTGMECVVIIDGSYAAAFHFRDEPRPESKPFVRHLRPLHHVNRIMLVSGDRASEARYLAGLVGISEVHSGKSPEEKVALVMEETAHARTLFVGDGINDAPALAAATVGVAFGPNTDIASEAAGAVVFEASLSKVDELIHLGRRMRTIALESALGGMILSVLGMLAAATGYLPPIGGAVAQEIIDVVAVLNALRAALALKDPTDF